MKRTKMQAEMRRLFGEPLVRLADTTDPAGLDLSESLMDRVHDGVDVLLALHGNADGQTSFVQALPHDVRLVLCMWLMDTGLAAKLVRVAIARAS